MSVTVRAATIEDARAIAVVHVEGWRASYRTILTREFLDGLSVEKRQALWTESLSEPPTPTSRVIVAAEDDGAIAGFAAVGTSRDEDTKHLGELMALYVLPSHWDRGVGRDVHDAALAVLAVAGFAGAIVWVLADNARGRAFYDRRGWKADGSRKQAPVGGANYTELRYRIGFVGVA